MERVDELRSIALNSAISFLKGTSSAISAKDVTDTADTFHRFLLGAWPAATAEEVKGLEAEAAKPSERTFHGDNAVDRE